MEHRSRKKSYIVSPPHGIVALAAILAAALLLIAGAGALMGHKKRLQTDANAVDSAMKPLTQEELRVKVQQAGGHQWILVPDECGADGEKVRKPGDRGDAGTDSGG